MKVALVTFLTGTLAGFLAQRSRLCLIGGLRDFLLIRDTALLKGALAFFLAAWLTFPLAALAGAPVWQTGAHAQVPAPAAPGGAAVSPAQPAARPAARTLAPCGSWRPGPVAALTLLVLAGGAGLGLAATLSNGCPLRQHVLAAQGNGDASWWLGGFYAGAVFYHAWFLPRLAACLP